MEAVGHGPRIDPTSLIVPEINPRLTDDALSLDTEGFDVLQRHFYEGYDRLLLRAVELERLEFGLPPDRGSLTAVGNPGGARQPLQHQRRPVSNSRRPKAQQAVTFSPMLPVPPPVPTSPLSALQSASSGGRPLARRNTIQGIKQEGTYLIGHSTAATPRRR